MRAYLKPLLIFGLIVLLVVVASWVAFPGWRAQPGGAITLIGAAILGVVAILKDAVGIAKNWHDLTKPAKSTVSAPPPKTPTQTQVMDHSAEGEQTMKHSGGNQKQTMKDSPRGKQRMT